jgi:glycosyltransferase involved in cell wall biosynthesis
VDATRFVPNPECELPSSVSKQLSDADRPLLGFVGGITEYKGVFDLAAAIKRTEANPTVVVAGDGPAREQFEAALGKQGIFLGSVDYEQMPAVYAAIDALVLPSHTEGLPRVILEAGAAGKPVIATRVGGVPEVVDNGRTGLLCPPRNPGRLATTIDSLLNDYNTNEMGDAARSAVLNQYTWSVQYDRYESFLESVCVTNSC